MKTKYIDTVIKILQAEVDGDFKCAMGMMSESYTQTWMYETEKGALFPSVVKPKESEMKDVYEISGRSYTIYDIAENNNTVYVECIESYPKQNSDGYHKTPLILVVKFNSEDKIEAGRHYCDPKLSYKTLSEEEISKAYLGQEPILIIK